MTTMQALWQTFFQEEDDRTSPAEPHLPLPLAKRARTTAAASQQQQQQQQSLQPLAPKPTTITTATANAVVPIQPAASPWTFQNNPTASCSSATSLPFPVTSASGGNRNINATSLPIPLPQAAVTAAAAQPGGGIELSTQAQVVKQHRTEHRKRKNAQYARVTRERKRNAELLLNLELASLERENERLKTLVKTHLAAEEAQAVIAECCYDRAAQLFPVTPTATAGDPTSSTKLVRSDFELIESLTRSRQAFVLTDPRLPDNPIVYASRPFLALTGYSREQVLGRNCRILQGIETDPAAVAEIREAVAAGKDGAACLLNYKADGTPFWNQFFVAPLRDKHNRIVNYVGVQHQIDKPEPVHSKKASAAMENNEKEDEYAAAATVATAATAATAADSNNNTVQESAAMKTEVPIFTPPSPPITTPFSSSLEKTSLHILERGDSTLIMKDEDMDMVDWAELAQALEGDYHDFDSFADGAMELDMSERSKNMGVSEIATAAAEEEEEEELNSKGADLLSREGDTLSTCNDLPEPNLTYLEQFFTSPPREFVVRTVRSELIDTLLSNGGDITDNRFLQGFNVLSELFRSSIKFNTSLSEVLNGSWKSISRPMYHYGGCVGMNERGDFVYTLGKMCFNMFKPGNVRVTVQNTMNHIEPVCRMDQLPSAAPWSLRRELCLQDPETLQASKVLKSYDVVVALTIEPEQFAVAKGEVVPSPARRLKALQVARGYFLPDPETPNRLTVWFTGGELAPAPFSEEDLEKGYGGLDDWVEFFGAEYKRTWTEALSDMGAKLFLGAELPNEMDPNGKMEYILHRPFGGHGKGHADVMYVDGELLITKGQSGSIHVMVAQK